MDKPHETFRKVIKYCDMMGYDIKDILDMSNHELRLWYHRVLDMVENETEFRIRTGLSIDKEGKRHKVLSIIDGRNCSWKKKDKDI